jgi:opacity protein-like surface antigen
MLSAVRVLVPLGALCLLLASPFEAAAQGFGIGARIASVKADSDDDDSVRFTGGQVRMALGQRAGLEVSLDRHTETFEALNERVKETPIQASLLLFLAGGSFKPYLLGGPGWYNRKVESLDETGEESISTRKFGWHGGFGAEFRMGRHAGLHADYRYTFLRFSDDDDEDEAAGTAGATNNDSFISRLLPSHDGSMWTVGFSIYF